MLLLPLFDVFAKEFITTNEILRSFIVSFIDVRITNLHSCQNCSYNDKTTAALSLLLTVTISYSCHAKLRQTKAEQNQTDHAQLQTHSL